MDIRTIIVEMAAIVGSIKSLRALNMCLVNVALTPPEMKIEMMTSSNEVKNANNAEAVSYTHLTLPTSDLV